MSRFDDFNMDDYIAKHPSATPSVKGVHNRHNIPSEVRRPVVPTESAADKRLKQSNTNHETAAKPQNTDIQTQKQVVEIPKSASSNAARESMNRTAHSYMAKRASSAYGSDSTMRTGKASPVAPPAITEAAQTLKTEPLPCKTQGDSAVTQNSEKKKTVAFSDSDLYDYVGYKRRRPRHTKKLSVGMVVRRSLLVIASVLLFLVITLYSLCFVIAKGPSETVRNLLVLSAKQASATKWVPSLFLDKSTIDNILAQSAEVNTDVISIDDYGTKDDGSTETKDEWADAVDGMKFFTIKGSTYTAYMLIVKDPSRIFVGTSSDFKSGKTGSNIFDACADWKSVAAINGGEFSDPGGVGTGNNPMGLTYSNGNCVWSDGLKRTFIGFDSSNKLIVAEGMSKKDADALRIRDAVSFQTGNILISSDGANVTLYYADGDNGTAQRTAIGQRSDGAVIMLVTDGRTASSLGATHNDVIDIMVEYGAVSAAMLDGGSSTMLYYEDYFKKYDFDYDSLDQYQKRGLVNKYKAFTAPRRIPTFFMVSPLG